MNQTILAILMLSQGLSTAQEAATPRVAKPPGEPLARTCIPHPLNVLQFTPPPLRVEKKLPACRIDASVTHRASPTTTLTLQRGEASTAPDLPPPPPPPLPTSPTEPTPEQLARRLYALRHSFNLGATIFDHRLSVIQWTDPVTLTPYRAICGFDVGLLAGVGDFIHCGEKYRFFLIHSHYDTTAVHRFANRWRIKIPEVPEGGILITHGDPADTAAAALPAILGGVIDAEKDRLLAYQAARQTYFAASAAWHAAHPIPPRSETIILRPHRGSRYLTNPTPGKSVGAK
ncbi:MAG: hypothetical protein K9N23_17300 [Akkermansiaceae bacterium]|nr:hypothetical protein [Akkermansiaceae bacterium]